MAKKPPMERRPGRTTHGSRPMCAALARQTGKPCGKVAGYGTDHLGSGNCKFHGGRNVIKHGRYSTMKREALRELIAQHEADPDPLNIFPELAAARALFQDYIERYDAWAAALIAWHESFESGKGTPKPVQILDIADAYRILSEVTKIAERIERVRAANAISRADLLRTMQEMGRVVERHVTDPAALNRIKDDWLSIKVA